MHSSNYKVFCYDSCYSINKTFSDKNHSADEVQTIENVLRLWLDNPDRKDIELNTSLSNLKEAENRIFRMAPAAGGIVKISDKLLVIKRNEIMDLPKGHLKKAEKAEIGAMREVEEETGVTNLEIVSKLPSTFHCYLLDGVWTFKETQWFEMKTNFDSTFVPQLDEDISEVKLIDIHELNLFQENTFRSLKEILAPEMRKIATKK